MTAYLAIAQLAMPNKATLQLPGKLLKQGSSAVSSGGQGSLLLAAHQT